MYKSLLALIFLFPVYLSAQPSANSADQQDIQNMMQLMKKVEACMNKIDKNELSKLELESNKFEDEVNDLCAKGKRDPAQKKAQAFGETMLKNITIIKVNKCNKMMEGITLPGDMTRLESDYKNMHVCDAILQHNQQ